MHLTSGLNASLVHDVLIYLLFGVYLW
jgi:hypothetical protein